MARFTKEQREALERRAAMPILASQNGSSVSVSITDLRALLSAYDEQRAALEAVLEYDALLESCGNDPSRMASACTAQGDDLDALYGKMRDSARAALEASDG